MASSYLPKDSKQKAISMTLGIVFILCLTAITYVVGWSVATGSSFSAKTGLFITYKMFGASYIAQAFGVLAGIIVYVIKFLIVGSKTYSNARFSRTTGDSSLPFVLKGWIPMAIVSCVVSVACAAVLFLISYGEFRGDLVTSLLLYIWLIQGVICGAAFFIPPFQPVKAQ